MVRWQIPHNFSGGGVGLPYSSTVYVFSFVNRALRVLESFEGQYSPFLRELDVQACIISQVLGACLGVLSITVRIGVGEGGGGG